MKNTLIFAAVVAASSVGLSSVQAQTLSDNPAPSEFPPDGFAGNQYADSRGCVFIRAGVDGNVTWVPRVTRDRKQVCNAQPTFAATKPAPAPAAPQQQTAAVQETAPAPKPAAPQPTPAPAATVAAAPKPATSAPIETVASTVTRKPAPAAKPRPQPVAAPKPVAKPQPVAKPAAPAPEPQLRVVLTEEAQQRRVTSACPNASEFSQRYINDGTRLPVRCGPQTLPGTSQTVAAGGGERILPSHLVEDRRQASAVRVPHGYTPAWDDDRLNPQRGEQTVQGYVATQRTWTNTVPRRLVPSTAAPQVTQPKVARQPVRLQAPPPPVVSTRQSVKTAPKAVKSAKAVAPQAKAQRIYVQLGMFGVEANAQRSAQAMAQTGFPTRMGTLNRKGKTYRLVMAGPFASEAEAKRALAAARRIGFSDAYLNRQK